MSRSAPDAISKGRSALRAQWHLRSATHVARTVRLEGKPVIDNHGTLTIGERVQLFSTIATLELAVGSGGTLDIGERALVNYGTAISAQQLVRIGPRSLIGTYCLLMDNDFHRIEPERRLERPESRPIVLGENVWLGGRVIVMPGVSIGDHSVVGAGSVVTRDVPPRTLVAGSPARVIREL
jgi:maltose O-acetyltransferase